MLMNLETIKDELFGPNFTGEVARLINAVNCEKDYIDYDVLLKVEPICAAMLNVTRGQSYPEFIAQDVFDFTRALSEAPYFDTLSDELCDVTKYLFHHVGRKFSLLLETEQSQPLGALH